MNLPKIETENFQVKLLKNKIILIFITIFSLQACQTEMKKPNSIEEYPTYNGVDLGLTYSPKQSTIKVYSPAVDSMRVHLYEKGHEGSPLETRQMSLEKNGIWAMMSH